MTHSIDRRWWHVYPLGFAGAAIRDAHEPVGGLRRIAAWLDYAVDLGFDGLLLGPVFASVGHGYDTLDHHAIDPRLGTLEDFDALVEAARERGVVVVLDGVFNHVAAEHRWVREAVAAGPAGGPDAMVAIDWADSQARLRTFEGHGALVELDHANPRVVAEVAAAMRAWLDRGVAGWRLDAAYAVPTEFWRAVTDDVRRTHPEAWFLGEVIHGDYAAFVRDAGVDTVTQYELWKAVWSAIQDRNLFELDWTMRRHAAMTESFVPATFVGNHDVTRIATRIGIDGAIAAATVLLTLPGTPAVYYGDEVGMRGVKEERVGGDDAVRPELPPAPPEDWGGAGDGHRVLSAHRELLAWRRARPWVTRATIEVLEVSNERLTYAVRGPEGEEARVTLEVADDGVRALLD